MSPAQAQDLLLLYRPGTADAADPQMLEALDLARRDPQLGRWLEQHRAFQKAMRAGFRQIEAPAHLKTSLLARSRVPAPIIIPHPWWRSPVWLTAGVAVVVLLGLIALWLTPRAPNRLANFQARVVSQALREYRMDLVTNDMNQVRQLMAQGGAPADYHLPPGLERLQLTGGGLLSWRSHPVAMVCFDRGDKQMLFLFVMKRAAVADPPPSTPQFSQVSHMQTVAWSRGDNTYLLAGPPESDFAKKYL